MVQLGPAWLYGTPGVAVGLFLARVALEATQRPWPGVLIATVGLLAAMGGLALARWLAQRWRLAKRRIRLWPALLLLVYVLWPQRDLVAAASVAVLAVLVWLLSGETFLPRWSEPLADGATFAAALAVYVATAAPDVLPADAGEFQLVATLLGVAHPPGFPLYTLMGHLFIRLLPWGTPAYRLNLMSGVMAAGALVLVARATRLWARRLQTSPLMAMTGGLAAALVLGTATTFWAQATIANKRTTTAFFAALALYALSRFATAAGPREADGALVLLGLALGLGLGHHPPLVFPGLFFVVYVLLTDPRLVVQLRRWWRPLLAGLVGLLPLAYLPIRGAMGAPQAPPGLDTLPGFLHHFLARGFAGDMFAFANATDLPHRLALLPTLFPFQFNLILLVAALLGLLGLLRRDWRLFVLLAGSLALQTFIAITYRAPQTVEYLMPAYLPVAIAVGLLPSLLSPRIHTPTLLCSLVIWAGLLNGWAHAPSFIELAEDHTARQAVGPLLETAPAGARILADWRWVTPLRYLQQIEGLRPDVEVTEVYPVAGEEYRETWLRRVRETTPERPLLLTHFYQFDGYTTEPWEAGFLLRPRPVMEPMASLTPVAATFGGEVRLLGYNLRHDQFPPSPRRGGGGGGVQFHPGQVVEFVLAWQPAEPLDFQPSFTLRLVDVEGRHVAQDDRALGTDVAPGEVRFERLALPLYPTMLPGRYRVTLGAYIVTDVGFENLTTAEGETAVTLAWLEVEPSTHTPFTLHHRWVPFAGGPTLVGVDYDRSVPDVLRVYLHWQGAADGGAQARVWTADGLEAIAPLPPIQVGAYQTVAVDITLPHSHTSTFPVSPLWLSLTDGQGQAKTASGPWDWPVGEVRLPAPAPDARFVPLGDEMVVVGATARPAASEETMAVDVTLVALRPLTTDDRTSVRLMGGDGRWLDTHDCQPALGAVPTLKWIRGSRVVDRHLLRVPGDFIGGEVRATLVVYEWFRMIPLPPMDGRFAATSEVPLGTWAWVSP